jgi:hypothetical protein
MNTDTLESFTASQLTQARAADFVRFLALQTKFSDDPNAEWLRCGTSRIGIRGR